VSASPTWASARSSSSASAKITAAMMANMSSSPCAWVRSCRHGPRGLPDTDGELMPGKFPVRPPSMRDEAKP
jgi:hypothetical protein